LTGKYEPLEQNFRGLPVSQEDVTLTFTFIEQILNKSLPASAQQELAGGEIKSSNPLPILREAPCGSPKSTHVFGGREIQWMDAGWP